jgi:hypothetical protein
LGKGVLGEEDDENINTGAWVWVFNNQRLDFQRITAQQTQVDLRLI